MILEENGLIHAAELTINTADKRMFIPALYDYALECATQKELYKAALINNFKRYYSDPKFRKQYDALHQQGFCVPIQVIPTGDKLEVLKLANGKIAVPDALGNIHTFSKGNPSTAITKLSETGKKAFLLNNAETSISKIVEKFNAPTIVKNAEKSIIPATVKTVESLQKFCPITKDAADKVAEYFKVDLQKCTGKGWKIKIPYKKNKPLIVRIMEAESGKRYKPYFRISYSDKSCLDINGKLCSTAPELTHFDISNNYLNKIQSIIEKFKANNE